MSTLVTSNISDGTTSVGTGYVVNGSAKAWVDFTQLNTQTIYDSFNVSSITDVAVGRTTPTFTNAMSGLRYHISFSQWDNDFYTTVSVGAFRTASSFLVAIANTAASGNDADGVTVSSTGDLA